MQVAAVGLRKVCFASSETIPSQSCICSKYFVVWRLATFILYVFLQTKPLIELFKEKKFLLKSMPYARTLISSMKVPHLNSIVFYYKTTMWPFLSWTTCSHVCSRTRSCFGVYYRSSNPENLTTSSRHLCCKLSFRTCCLKYPITNQI